jgi:hypothetical protein
MSLVCEHQWPPKPKVGRSTVHLQVSFGPVPLKNWQLPSFIKQKRGPSSATISELTVEKKIRMPTVVPTRSALWGNVVSNIVAYLPGRLHLQVTIKLLDDDLGILCADSLIIHESFRSMSNDESVVWSLETDNSWDFISPEPDEIILRNVARHESFPGVSHECQYGLKKSSWESFGSMVIRVSSFSDIIHELMRDLGYPDRKINVSLWYPIINVLPDALHRNIRPIGGRNYISLNPLILKSRCSTIQPTSTERQYISKTAEAMRKNKISAMTSRSLECSSVSDQCTEIRSRRKYSTFHQLR